MEMVKNMNKITSNKVLLLKDEKMDGSREFSSTETAILNNQNRKNKKIREKKTIFLQLFNGPL